VGPEEFDPLRALRLVTGVIVARWRGSVKDLKRYRAKDFVAGMFPSY
jgi:hypothetical protein